MTNRDMSGVLFRNDKGDNPSRPDYRGDIVINNVNYKLSAWIKDGKKGKFMSIAAQLDEGQQSTAQAVLDKAPF